MKDQELTPEMVPVGTPVVVRTLKDKSGIDRTEKYGRYLAVPYMRDW